MNQISMIVYRYGKGSFILYLAKQSHIQNHYQVSSDPLIAVCYIITFKAHLSLDCDVYSLLVIGDL